MTGRCPIVVVDDDEGIRNSLASLLQAHGYPVDTYADGTAFLAERRDAAPFCLILDMNMPGLNGFQVFERLRETAVRIPTIFLTGEADIPMAVEAMRLGAIDFLEKPADPETLLASLARARAIFDEAPSDDGDMPGTQTPRARLTAREQDVLDLLVLGHTNKVIAQKLSISPRTVEVHRARVKEKLSARNLADLMRHAQKAA